MKDNPIKEFFRILTDVVLLNLLWILASFLGLLITLGASTTAMFRVSFQLLKRDEPSAVLALFIKSFKENFAASTFVWMGIIICGTPLYFMYQFALNQGNTGLLILSFVFIYQIVIFTIYSFPILAIFDSKTPQAFIKNVLMMSNRNLWTNFKVIGSLFSVFLLIVYVHPMFFLVIISLYGLMVSFHLKKLFDPIFNSIHNTQEKEEDPCAT